MIYILMCDVWNGTNYGTEVVYAYKNKEDAESQAKSYQGGVPKCDVNYFVVEVELV